MHALSPQYLEEDRRRAALSAKEARSNRRKDERQLKEYVHTLEVHLDQVQQYIYPHCQIVGVGMLNTIRKYIVVLLSRDGEYVAPTDFYSTTQQLVRVTVIEHTNTLL